MIDAINARRQPDPGRIAWVGDVSGSPAEIPLLVRGDLATPGPKVGPVPAFLTDTENRYLPKVPYPGSSSTGRRLALARWLTQPGERPAAPPGSRAGKPDLATPFRNRPGGYV